MQLVSSVTLMKYKQFRTMCYKLMVPKPTLTDFNVHWKVYKDSGKLPWVGGGLDTPCQFVEVTPPASSKPFPDIPDYCQGRREDGKPFWLGNDGRRNFSKTHPVPYDPPPRPKPPASSEKVSTGMLKYRGTRMMLTVHKHISLEDVMYLKALLKSRSRSSLPAKVKAFTEIGKTGHKHTHIIFLYPKRTALESQAKWDKVRTRVGPFQLKPITTDEHMTNAIKYDVADKKGGENSESKLLIDEIGDWTPEIPFHITAIEFIQDQKNFIDVLKHPLYGKYVQGKLQWAKLIFNSKPPPHMALSDLFKWQTFFDLLCQLPPDDRSIHWIIDRIGGNGKSALINHICCKYEAFMIDDGASKDIAFAYEGQPIVCIDLVRDSEEWVPYRMMEKFKNSRMFSAKYESHMKLFKPPHVIVMANFAPDMTKLSPDRWLIYDLKDKCLNLRPNPQHHMYSNENKEFKKLKNLCSGLPYNVKQPPASSPVQDRNQPKISSHFIK